MSPLALVSLIILAVLVTAGFACAAGVSSLAAFPRRPHLAFRATLPAHAWAGRSLAALAIGAVSWPAVRGAGRSFRAAAFFSRRVAAAAQDARSTAGRHRQPALRAVGRGTGKIGVRRRRRRRPTRRGRPAPQPRSRQNRRDACCPAADAGHSSRGPMPGMWDSKGVPASET